MATTIKEFYLEDSLLSAGQSTTVHIVFEQRVVGFTSNSLGIKGGSLSNLQTSDNGKSWTATVTASDDTYNGKAVITVFGGTFYNGEDFSPGSGEGRVFDIDSTAPLAPTIELPDAGADGIYNKDEVNDNGTVTATITLPKSDNEFETTKPGDVLIVNDEEITITQDMIDNGYQVEVEPGTDITVSIRDKAGNVGEAATQQVPAANLAAPEIEISIDPVTEDGVINSEEAQQDVAITGTVTGDFNAGDEVTLTVNGTEYTKEVNAQGKFSIELDGSVLTANASRVITAAIVTTNAAGNSGEATATKEYAVDTEAGAPTDVTIGNGDDFITSDEIDEDGNVDVTVGLPEDAKAGDTLTVNGEDTVLTEDDITNGEATVKVPAPEEGETLDVEATITDTAGNESTPAKDDAVRETALPPTEAPSITIVDDTDNNAILTAQEIGYDGKVHVKVGIPSEAANGDVVTIVNQAGEVLQKFVVGTNVIAGETKQFAVNVPEEGQSLKVTATIANPGGEKSAFDYAHIATSSNPSDGDMTTIIRTMDRRGEYIDITGNNINPTRDITGNQQTSNGDDRVLVLQNVTAHSIIELGDGDNELYIGTDGRYGKVIDSEITGGSGDDFVTIKASVTSSNIDLGDGNNVFEAQYGGLTGGPSTFTSGNGDDVYVMRGSVNTGSSISLGAGDDVISVGGFLNPNHTGVIDGGEGLDVLTLSGGASGRNDYNNVVIRDIELVDLSGQRAEYNIRASDVFTETTDTVFINQSSISKVMAGKSANIIDLGDNSNFQISGNRVTNEGDFGEFNLTEQGVKMSDPMGAVHTYDVYTSSEGTLYIEDNIWVI